MNLNFLTKILGAPNATAVAQTNFEKIDSSLAFMLQPSIDGTGLPTVNLGAPTTGAHVLNELWVDALGAVWKCTAAGAPGTWIQVREAVVTVATKPANPAIDNYLVRIVDDAWKFYSWSVGGGAYVDRT